MEKKPADFSEINACTPFATAATLQVVNASAWHAKGPEPTTRQEARDNNSVTVNQFAATGFHIG